MRAILFLATTLLLSVHVYGFDWHAPKGSAATLTVRTSDGSMLLGTFTLTGPGFYFGAMSGYSGTVSMIVADANDPVTPGQIEGRWIGYVSDDIFVEWQPTISGWVVHTNSKGAGEPYQLWLCLTAGFVFGWFLVSPLRM